MSFLVENSAAMRDNGEMSDEFLSHISVGRILRCPAHTARKLILKKLEHVIVDGQPRVARAVLEAWIRDRMIQPDRPVGPSVYFVASMDLQRVKIGKTRSNIERGSGRVLDLQNQSPYPILFVGAVDGYSAVERWMHVEFRAYRLHGEWFLAHDALDSLIARIQREGRGVSKSICPGAHLMDASGNLAVDLSAWHPDDANIPFASRPSPPGAPVYGPQRATPLQLARRHYMTDPSKDRRSKQNRGKR